MIQHPDLADVMLMIIVPLLDLVSICELRKTCKNLRTLISKKPKAFTKHVSHLFVQLNPLIDSVEEYYETNGLASNISIAHRLFCSTISLGQFHLLHHLHIELLDNYCSELDCQHLFSVCCRHLKELTIDGSMCNSAKIWCDDTSSNHLQNFSKLKILNCEIVKWNASFSIHTLSFVLTRSSIPSKNAASLVRLCTHSLNVQISNFFKEESVLKYASCQQHLTTNYVHHVIPPNITGWRICTPQPNVVLQHMPYLEELEYGQANQDSFLTLSDMPILQKCTFHKTQYTLIRCPNLKHLLTSVNCGVNSVAILVSESITSVTFLPPVYKTFSPPPFIELSSFSRCVSSYLEVKLCDGLHIPSPLPRIDAQNVICIRLIVQDNFWLWPALDDFLIFMNNLQTLIIEVECGCVFFGLQKNPYIVTNQSPLFVNCDKRLRLGDTHPLTLHLP